VKGGLITEKNVVEVPDILIDLFKHKLDKLDTFKLIKYLDDVCKLQFTCMKFKFVIPNTISPSLWSV